MEIPPIQIGVRDLVTFVLCQGDLNLDFVGSRNRVVGIRIHQKIQKSRPDNYQAEVAVSHAFQHHETMLIISGRIDGVFFFPDPICPKSVTVEEIKTVSRHWPENGDPLHWAQAKMYAWILANEKDLAKISVQLTYVHQETLETRELVNDFTVEELNQFARDIIQPYCQWALKLVDFQVIRNRSITGLQFPFPAFRPGQRDMAEAVYRCVKDQQQLIVQAATGIGKTMAALFPTIKAMGRNLCEKIFYLTARTTAQQAAESALDELRANGLRFKSVTLTAKDKICFHPGTACNPDACQFAKGHFDRVKSARHEFFHKDAITREIVWEIAHRHRVCPFELSLDFTLWADAVICDYNYAFDPRVYLRRFFSESTGNYAFLIDEAHNLPDRAREMFSAHIEKQAFLALRRQIKGKLVQLYKILAKINSNMLKIKKESETTPVPMTDKASVDALYPFLQAFLRIAEKWLAQNIQTEFRQALLDLYFQITQFVRIYEQYDECYCTIYDSHGKNLMIRLFCLDPSTRIGQCLHRSQSAILFSATLQPLTYFEHILGCEPQTHRLTIPSPFPPENLLVLVADRISTYYRDREHTADEIARMMITLVTAKPGNYLAFFPSYEYLNLVYSRFHLPNPSPIRTLAQTPAMTPEERDAFLNAFSLNNCRSLLGLAVMGGIFGEGIDLIGDRLHGAIIVGVGLPAICRERELIRDYFQKHHGTGFDFAYRYPGIHRVFQAAGRVIRTHTDKGIILLIDSRYATSAYQSLFPAHWQPLKISHSSHLAKLMGQFFDQPAGKLLENDLE